MAIVSSTSRTLLVAAVLLLFFAASSAARPDPAFLPSQTQVVDVAEKAVGMEESCDGIGEEECLMRRTLAAHIDYIYTQKQKH